MYWLHFLIYIASSFLLFALQERFIDEMERIITSKKKVTVRKEEGWFSEAEMKADLKWAT